MSFLFKNTHILEWLVKRFQSEWDQDLVGSVLCLFISAFSRRQMATARSGHINVTTFKDCWTICIDLSAYVSSKICFEKLWSTLFSFFIFRLQRKIQNYYKEKPLNDPLPIWSNKRIFVALNGRVLLMVSAIAFATKLASWNIFRKKLETTLDANVYRPLLIIYSFQNSNKIFSFFFFFSLFVFVTTVALDKLGLLMLNRLGGPPLEQWHIRKIYVNPKDSNLSLSSNLNKHKLIGIWSRSISKWYNTLEQSFLVNI